MFVKSATIWVGTIVILFTYEWRLALIILAVVFPQIFAQRISFYFLSSFELRYQKAKSYMSQVGSEAISNMRTVKAFADEEMTGLRFA